jgi:hypothetical protein
MIRFLVDEDFNGKIMRGVQVRNPQVDIIRVQATELYTEDDPILLEWAAREGRILITHDLDTVTRYTNERLAQGLPSAGVIFVRDTLPVAKVIEDLLTIVGASEPHEWENRIEFLPL